MTKLIFLFFLIAGQLSFGQSQKPTKTELLKVLNKSIQQKEKRKVAIDSNPWVTCNKDSIFYKSDTIKLYNNDQYHSYSNCCDFIDLTFYKQNAFVLTRAKLCKEPPTNSVAKLNDWYSIQFVKNESDLIIELISQGVTTDRFKVISLEKDIHIGQDNISTNVLTLVRLSKVPT